MSDERLSIEIAGDPRAPIELPRGGKLTIGSSSERADLVLSGQGVDAVHCAIGRLKEGGWAVKDLGSDFGIFINGERISSARLNVGDTLLIGSRRLRVLDARAPRPTPPPEPEPESASARARPAEAPSVRIRGYTLERLLGRGAMGEVWLAVQESLGRKVALKLLSPRLEADLDFVRRFQAEARAAAAWNHPNVVTVHDVGEDAGHHYLSMEFMAHGCLESRVAATGPVPPGQVLTILREAAAGLVYAESRGIVHRDIKPANLMQDEHGVTKIADLGLASQVEQEELQGERGKIFGTPHFLAPELIRGSAPDIRSDLYALGATAYRLLTGHTPFEGASSREILKSALRDEPVPPSRRRPAIPPGLDQLVLRLLSKDPAGRPPSAARLLSEIERLQAQGGAASPPATPAGGGRRLLVGVVVLAVLGAAAWAILGRGGEPERPPMQGGPSEHVSGVRPPPLVGESQPDIQASSTDEAPEVVAPSDPETLLLQREQAAGAALSALDSRVLSREERIQALRELADQHAGTDAALRARQSADALALESGAVAGPPQSNDPATQARVEMLAAVAKALEPAMPGESPHLAFERVQALPGIDAFAADTAFGSERARLEGEALERALQAARDVHARADVLESEGDFERYSELLTAFLRNTTPPPSPEGEIEARRQALRELLERAQQRLASIDQSKARYAARKEAQDVRALAGVLGGAEGLEQELAALDLRAAEARARAAAKAVDGESWQADLTRLADELAAGREALEALARGYEAGEWRRKTIQDPSKRGSAREATGADPAGVLVDGEKLPWKIWGGQPLELDKLLHARLSRSWSERELEGIAMLLRSAAVVEVLRVAAQAFDPARDSRVTPGEVEPLLALFDVAESWELPAALLERVHEERAAAAILLRALVAAGEGAYSRAVSEMERLFREHPRSLLVLLRSDGSDWRAPAAQATSEHTSTESDDDG